MGKRKKLKKLLKRTGKSIRKHAKTIAAIGVFLAAASTLGRELSVVLHMVANLLPNAKQYEEADLQKGATPPTDKKLDSLKTEIEHLRDYIEDPDHHLPVNDYRKDDRSLPDSENEQPKERRKVSSRPLANMEEVELDLGTIYYPPLPDGANPRNTRTSNEFKFSRNGFSLNALRHGPEPLLPYSGRDREAVSQAVSEHKPAVQECYQQALKANPGLAGQLIIRFALDAAGKVAEAEVVESTVGTEELAQCLLEKMRRWQFGQAADTDSRAVYRQRFTFGY